MIHHICCICIVCYTVQNYTLLSTTTHCCPLSVDLNLSLCSSLAKKSSVYFYIYTVYIWFCICSCMLCATLDATFSMTLFGLFHTVCLISSCEKFSSTTEAHLLSLSYSLVQYIALSLSSPDKSISSYFPSTHPGTVTVGIAHERFLHHVPTQ